jgi:hypothetical protein
MNIGELAQTIASYMNKSRADMTLNGMDKCLIALENARNFAENAHDWMHLKDRFYQTVTPGTAFTFPTTARKILKVWSNAPDAVSGPIDIISEADTWRRSGAYIGPPYPIAPNYFSTTGFYLVYRGATYWLFPANITLSGSTTVALTVYAAMRGTSYLNAADDYSDYFTQQGAGWMMYRALRELQNIGQVSKAGEQPGLLVTSTMLQEAWINLITEDISKSEGTFDVSLD